MSTASGGLLVYSPLYRTFSYGPDHPLRPTRLYLTHILMGACGLLAGPGLKLTEPVEAARGDLLRVHSNAYLDALDMANSGENFPDSLTWGLGFGDNPIFAGVRDWSYLVCGGTIMALREVMAGRSGVAFHTGGGFHHAHHAKAAGFCYVNDIAVAISEQVNQGQRILYLDLDAHHGDGVQEAFYGSDRVITVSIHESPEHLFPGTGHVNEMGEGEGYGFSVNVPLEPGSGDSTFIEAFERVFPSVLSSFSPDCIVMQLGVDNMTRDPLAHLLFSTRSLIHALGRVRELYSGPIMATGGGGYEMDTVARAWTLAWGILTGQKAPDELPEAYLKERARYGASGIRQMTLRDPEPGSTPDQTEPLRHLEHTLKFLREKGII
ncbi:MAG: acetoin utilization protein AcuC [bacterium]|nr:acetoin utilization protein AcuC [bacterium]MDT8366638.1 acetoin utilization protein AcuC [bacterium]